MATSYLLKNFREQKRYLRTSLDPIPILALAKIATLGIRQVPASQNWRLTCQIWPHLLTLLEKLTYAINVDQD